MFLKPDYKVQENENLRRIRVTYPETQALLSDNEKHHAKLKNFLATKPENIYMNINEQDRYFSYLKGE